MKILLARHGNTFASGDKVIWVGRGTDLPLVESGERQAHLAGEALKANGLIPTTIYCSTLQRTRKFAEIVAGLVGFKGRPQIDPGLDEIDYGSWEGRSNDEITALGPEAAAAMEAWDKRDVWPVNAGWRPDQATLHKSVSDFVAQKLAPVEGHLPLVVSSNGVLRLFPAFLGFGAARPSFKTRTGNLAVIERNATNAQLVCWDTAPDRLREALDAS